jgi:transcription antitermination factor NusB
MSSAHDPRRQQRISRVEGLFSWQFYVENSTEPPKASEHEHFEPILSIIPLLTEIDAVIMHYAPKHAIPEFNKIDLAILRQGLYELLYTETPAAVVIDEAVEIAKAYGSDETPSFIHGVLGNAADDRRKEQREREEQDTSTPSDN